MPRNGVWLFNHPRDVADTVEACALLQTEGDRAKACMRAIDYCHGFSKPHYKVPAVIGHIQITRFAVYFGNPQGYDCVSVIRKSIEA